MRHVASCETFRRAGRTTQLAFPTPPEKQTSDLEISQLLETIDDILAEFDRPTHVTLYKNTFLEDFMQRVENRTTQFLNDRYIQ
jgi:UDP-glucose 6-dehydrogenase